MTPLSFRLKRPIATSNHGFFPRAGIRWLMVLMVLMGGTWSAPSVPAQPPEEEIDWTVMALLADPAHFSAERVASAIAPRLSEEDKLAAIRTSGEGLTLELGKGVATITLTPLALPAADMLDACKHASWYWRGACDTVKKHQAHVRVMLRGSQLRKVDSAVLVTRLLAAVTAESQALATAWGSNLQPADVFQKAADNLARDRVPVNLWINFRYSREASGNVSIITRGMPAFELMEIESRDTPYPGRDLLEMIMNTSQRLIMKGSVIADGETIGGAPGRRVHVRFADSLWTPGRKVYRVEVGS